MQANIPGMRRLRHMLEGESTVFPFRDGKPRPDVQVTAMRTRIGGKFETAVRLLVDPAGPTIERVCVVTCVEAAPVPAYRKRGRPKRNPPTLPELREEYIPETGA